MEEGKKMTKIDIISGFLGAGKTTLINKLINNFLIIYFTPMIYYYATSDDIEVTTWTCLFVTPFI